MMILAELLRFRTAVPVWQCEPEMGILECPFPDVLVALRATSRQMYREAGFVFMSNKFHFSSFGDITYFARHMDELHCRSLRHVILGKDAMSFSVPSDVVGSISFHTIRVLAALRNFPNLKTLAITLPWTENGLHNPDFGNFIGFLATSTATHVLIIDRPDVDRLLPGNTGHPHEFSIPMDARQQFLSTILANHPLGYYYPDNAQAIITKDMSIMRELNARNERIDNPFRTGPSIEIVQLQEWLAGRYEPWPGMIWRSTTGW